MSWTYPNTDLDDWAKLAALTSPFWSQVYGGASQVISFFLSTRPALRQLWSQLGELAASIGVGTCPPFHTQDWYEITLLASQAATTPGSPVTSFPLPSDVRNAALLVDNALAPTTTWGRNTDFWINPATQTIVFASNPFLNPALVPAPVFTGTVVTDQQLSLWAFKTQRDWQYLQEQFGYVVNVMAASGPNYSRLLAALFNAVARGANHLSFLNVVSAVLDVPFVQNAVETVVDIATDTHGLLVLTDQNVYRYTTGANPLVTIGQQVTQGQAMTDVVRHWESRHGQPPSWLSSLSLGSGFLLTDLSGPLTFSNTVVPLTVQTNVSGYTKLSWSLGGNANDATTFFNDMHSRGVAAGATLANYLDQRVVKVGQPDATMLPTTVNPLAFLFQNVLRDNCLILSTRSAYYGPGSLASTLNLGALLRQIVPPHAAALIVAS